MMTLGNRRENGVRSLAITCGALWCHHEGILDVSAYGDDVGVPSFCGAAAQHLALRSEQTAKPHWDTNVIALNATATVCATIQ